MSSTTTNLGLVKMASGETIGQWSDANNGSGANLDKIDTAIGNLNSQITSLVTSQSVEIPININANSSVSTTADLTLSGYTPIGIIQIDFNNDNCYVMKYSIYANTLYIRIHNDSATAYTNAKCTVRVLYLKS